MVLYRKPVDGDVYVSPAPDIETALEWATEYNKNMIKACPLVEKKERKSLLLSRIQFILDEVGTVVAYVPLDPTNLTETRRTMNRNYLLWRGWHNENPVNG